MTLFILYQTDIWKTKSSRIYLGIFDSRIKATDIAKYHKLHSSDAKIVIEEVTLNQFMEE